MTEENKQSEGQMHSDMPKVALHSAPVDALKTPRINMGDLNVAQGFKNLISVLKFDKKAIEEIGMDEKAGANALVFMLIPAILNPIISIFVLKVSVVFALVSLILGVLGMWVAIYGTSFSSVKLFHGQGTFAQYFRVLGLAYGVNIIGLLGLVVSQLSILTSIAGLWVLALYYFAAKLLFKMDTKNTIFSLLVALVIIIVWSMLVGMVMVAVVGTAALTVAPAAIN